MSSIAQTNLKERVLRAGFWSVAGFGLSTVIRFATNLVMTRLLMPEMFGLMSLATTFMIGLAMISDLGLRQFVIQHARGSEASYLNTAWVIQIGRGLMLWILALGVSLIFLFGARLGIFPRTSVYASPQLPLILAALSFTTLISGFTSTKLLEANRGLALGLVTRNEIVSQLIGIACMIAWASIDRSAWALVAGSFGSTIGRVILSHMWLPGPPNRWAWDVGAAKQILHMGQWIFLASILGFLVNSGDQLLLAGLTDATTLGLYVIAYLYVGSVESLLARLMSDVSFPAFSEIVRNRRSDLKRSYYRFHVLFAGVSYTCSGFLITAGETLVGLLYDKRYASAGPIMAALAPILLTLPARLITQAMLALGRAELQSHILAVRLIALFILTPVGFLLFGFWGALVGVVLSHFAYLPLILYYNAINGLLSGRNETVSCLFFLFGLIAGELASIGIGRLGPFWRT